MRRIHLSTDRCTKLAALLEHLKDLMMGIKGDRKTGRQVTRAVQLVRGWADVHLKIVVDVIKDTVSTDGGRQGACCGSDLSKERMLFIGRSTCALHLDVT